jgi:hypothetical protein
MVSKINEVSLPDLDEYDDVQNIPPYVYVVIRGIAMTMDEEEQVRRDIADRMGSDYVVMGCEDPGTEPEEVVPDAAA